jgi:class 3 adenylate cyclase
MRLLILYIAQVAFLIASFATVCSVFVTLNGAITQELAVSVVNTVVARLVDQATAPFETLSKQMVELAQTAAANPSIRSGDNRNALWNEPIDAQSNASFMPTFDLPMNPLDAAMFAIVKANPLVGFVYTSFEMPDNSSQWADRTVYLLPDGAARLYYPSFKRGTDGWPAYVYCDNIVPPTGVLPLQFNYSGCSVQYSTTPPQTDWHVQTRQMTQDVATTGMWRAPWLWLDPVSDPPQRYVLVTFAIPITFKSNNPWSPAGGTYCSEVLQMDISVSYLNELLRTTAYKGVELAIFDDGSDNVLAWSVAEPSVTTDDAGNMHFKPAAHTNNAMFDAALDGLRAHGYCGDRVASCDAHRDPVVGSKYIFAVRRITHLNARFTVVVVGDKDTFMGRGIQARNAGISVSVASLVVCLIISLSLWVAIVRPLRALIANMQLAALFDASAKGDTTSCLTEMHEANAAFDGMQDQLQAAKPFMPRHLLALFDQRRREVLGLKRDSSDEDEDLQVDIKKNSQRRSATSFHESGSDSAHSATGTRSRTSAKRLSHATSKISSEGAVGKQLLALDNRSVAVLVINIREFSVLTKRTSTAALQADYAAFVSIVNEESRRLRGVLDTAQGDHFIISFNSSTHCNNAAAGAVRTAFAIHNRLQDCGLSSQWAGVSMGVARGRALCGAVGSLDFRTHATLGSLVRHALCCQRYSRALLESKPDCWLVGPATVIEEVNHIAHYRYVATAVLPPSCNSRYLIAAMFPPGAKKRDTIEREANAEWLYELDSLQRSNPHAAFNAAVVAKWTTQDKGQGLEGMNETNALNRRVSTLTTGLIDSLSVDEHAFPLHTPDV